MKIVIRWKNDHFANGGKNKKIIRWKDAHFEHANNTLTKEGINTTEMKQSSQTEQQSTHYFSKATSASASDS